MTGGLIQLVARANQDLFLIHEPQITFFKVVYRRHTNFSMESIQQTFNGQADFGTHRATASGREQRTLACERVGDVAARDHSTKRMPIAEGLGDRNDVGHDPLLFETPEVVTEAPRAHLDLVGDAQPAVGANELVDAG